MIPEETLSRWAAPPSTSEQERCANAESAVKKAVSASRNLTARNVDVFTHGSYWNRVNVRGESDIDIGVRVRATIFFDLPPGTQKESFGISAPSYSYSQFKIDLQVALAAYFGPYAVSRGDKAFDIKSNTYRVDADVAPFFEYRLYHANGHYYEGVALNSDANHRIVNWPDQHYKNAVAKNDRTSRNFKGIVRILKRVAVELEERGALARGLVPGFLIECMTYNVPDSTLTGSTWRGITREVLAFLFNNTLQQSNCTSWTEVSGMKWLFTPDQKWRWQDAHAFTGLAWNLLGFQ